MAAMQRTVRRFTPAMDTRGSRYRRFQGSPPEEPQALLHGADGEPRVPPGEQEPCVGRSKPEPGRERLRGAWVEHQVRRAPALSRGLAQEAGVEVHVVYVQPQKLRDPQAGVEEEQQDREVPGAKLAGWGREQDAHHAGQLLDGHGGPAVRRRLRAPDAGRGVGAEHASRDEVPREPPDDGEPPIAGRGGEQLPLGGASDEGRGGLRLHRHPAREE